MIFHVFWRPLNRFFQCFSAAPENGKNTPNCCNVVPKWGSGIHNFHRNGTQNLMFFALHTFSPKCQLSDTTFASLGEAVLSPRGASTRLSGKKRTEPRATRKSGDATSQNADFPDPEIWGRRSGNVTRGRVVKRHFLS